MTTKKSTPEYQSNIDVTQRINRIYDHLYANSPVRTPSGIAREVGKLLHVAMFIEQESPRLWGEEFGCAPAFSFSNAEVRRLASCGDNRYIQVARDVREQFERMNKEWSLYARDEKMVLSDADIAYCCGELSGIVVSDPTRDIFGDALEIFRGQWAKRASGQFFTDPLVTSLAMKLIDFDPRRGDDLVDLCSGTAGFLLAGLNHIRYLLEQDGELDEKELVKLASGGLKGQEIDQEVCEIANATLAARLGVHERSCVVVGDSLQSSFGHPEIKMGSHLCVATNPPFGTKITIKDREILNNYELSSPKGKLSNRAPDILFVEQNLRLVKLGEGRVAIVVPYQILSGPQTAYVREWILRHAQILAVVDLPADTFQPHTGTKGALLVLKRRVSPLASLNEIEDSRIFMSMPRWIGHDRRGRPVYRSLSDGSQSNDILSDFHEVESALQAFNRGGDPAEIHQESFQVKTSDILRDPEYRMNALFLRPRKRSHDLDHGSGKLAEKWEVKKIGDVVQRIFYPPRFKRSYVDKYAGAVPFLGGANISQLTITTNKWLRHDDPKLDELQVKAGWILITRSGSTGIVSIVPPAWDGYAMSEHIIRVVPDESEVSAAYLYSFLRTRYAQDILARGVFGSVIDEINPEFIGLIEMPIPKSEDVLNSLIGKTLEALSARNRAIELIEEAEEEINSRLLDSL